MAKKDNLESTTIKISRKTKERLDNLKEFRRESYEEVINKILHILNISRKNPVLGNKALGSIDRNIKRKESYGRVIHSSEES